MLCGMWFLNHEFTGLRDVYMSQNDVASRQLVTKERPGAVTFGD